MAQRFRVDRWYLDVWNGGGWTRKGPYPEDGPNNIDCQFDAHIAVMPNCPVRVVGEVFDQSYPGNKGEDWSGIEHDVTSYASS